MRGWRVQRVRQVETVTKRAGAIWPLFHYRSGHRWASASLISLSFTESSFTHAAEGCISPRLIREVSSHRSKDALWPDHIGCAKHFGGSVVISVVVERKSVDAVWLIFQSISQPRVALCFSLLTTVYGYCLPLPAVDRCKNVPVLARVDAIRLVRLYSCLTMAVPIQCRLRREEGLEDALASFVHAPLDPCGTRAGLPPGRGVGRFLLFHALEGTRSAEILIGSPSWLASTALAKRLTKTWRNWSASHSPRNVSWPNCFSTVVLFS